MKTTELSEDDFALFPFHDSKVTSLKLDDSIEGIVTVIVEMQLAVNGKETTREKGRPEWQACQLRFERCWRVATDFLGFSTAQQTVDHCVVVRDSALISELRKYGLGNEQMRHYRVSCSGGSVLNVISEKVVVLAR